MNTFLEEEWEKVLFYIYTAKGAQFMLNFSSVEKNKEIVFTTAKYIVKKFGAVVESLGIVEVGHYDKNIFLSVPIKGDSLPINKAKLIFFEENMSPFETKNFIVKSSFPDKEDYKNKINNLQYIRIDYMRRLHPKNNKSRYAGFTIFEDIAIVYNFELQ